MNMGVKRLLFYSRYAFFPQLYAVFDLLRSHYGVQGFVITHERMEVPKVYAPSGYLTRQSAGLTELPEFVTAVPENLKVTDQTAFLLKKVKEIGPDFIWAHEEPNDIFVNQILRQYRNNAVPKIAVYLSENVWTSPGGYRSRWAKFKRQRLWRRYNGVLATATKSAESVRNYGMPASVPITIAWTPNLPPPRDASTRITAILPSKKTGEVFVGFAGRITAAKGWRVLLAALTQLPDNFKCLIAGTGDEEAELRLLCELPALRARVHYLGVLEKNDLWAFYRTLDIFVLPSLTTLFWAEQFGFVLAEAMACGVPVVGSNSGAIPEVIGDCGIVVAENDSAALAEALHTLANNADLRERYVQCGLRRFDREFTVAAYAGKVAALLGLTSGS